MDMKRFFLYAIAIAALALAGCGGNGGGTPPVDPGPAPVVPGTTTGPTTAELFAMAQDLGDNSKTYATGTTDAVDAAMKNSMKLDVMSVAGDSSMAAANAKQVLDAQITANGSVDHIMTALDDAKSALANDVDADDAQADALTRALEQAIMVAEEQLEAAKMAAEGDDLKTAVEMVTGADPDAEGYPRTPTQVGATVAMAIGGALMPMSPTDGAGVRVMPGTTAPAGTIMNAVKMDDHQGETWAEIVGADKIMEMRIGATGGGTMRVMAASVAGMTATDLHAALTDMGGTGTTNEYADGFQTPTDTPSRYNGIPGTAFCGGSDCSVDEDDNLAGSWYFAPMSPKEWYVKLTADAAYTVENLYARFGHWLTADVAGATVINTYAMIATGGTTTGFDLATVNTGDDATTLTDTSAKYTGNAAGMSLHKELDSQGKIVAGTLQSGAFTADVTLTATFGDNATLGGTISNFQSDNSGAVDPLWSVNLLTRGFDGSFDDNAPGTTVTSGSPGEWSAQAYGVDGARPTGVFGGFNAHFSDGHAAGAYATRK